LKRYRFSRSRILLSGSIETFKGWTLPDTDLQIQRVTADQSTPEDHGGLCRNQRRFVCNSELLFFEKPTRAFLRRPGKESSARSPAYP
jgi:hypothetical protein